MAYDLRFPMITGTTEKEQLTQIKSYLHQLVEQLQWSLNNIDKVQIQYVNTPAKRESSKKEDLKGTQATFNDLKPLIIKSAEIVNAYYEEINERLEGIYVAQSDFGTFVEQTNQEITKNSTNITQVFTNVQTIAADVDTLDSNLADVDKSVQDVDKSVQDVDKNLWDIGGKLDNAKEDIDNSLKALSNDLGELDSGVQDLKDEVEGELKDVKEAIDDIVYTLVEVNAVIKSGLLYYDENEIPVYGLEIGQTNTIDGVKTFDKFARFTSDRLSFYDKNDVEVAYISDYKLYITNAEITGTLKLGAFRIDTSNGFRLKYVGKG